MAQPKRNTAAKPVVDPIPGPETIGPSMEGPDCAVYRHEIGRERPTEETSSACECENYISQMLEDSLPAGTKEKVQKHLANCEICSAILDSTRNILILTADDRVFELPVGYSERLHARLEREIPGKNSRAEKPTRT